MLKKIIAVCLIAFFLLLVKKGTFAQNNQIPIEVLIKSAQNLPKQKPNGERWDYLSPPDPFVTILLNDEPLLSTTAIKDNRGEEVLWNESFTLYVNPEKDVLAFRVWDKDIGINDLMGEYSFGKNIIQAGFKEFELHFKNGIVLKIEIRLKIW